MSFEVTGGPLPDDIDRYRQTLKIPADAIIRDVARLVTVVLRGVSRAPPCRASSPSRSPGAATGETVMLHAIDCLWEPLGAEAPCA